MVYPYGNNLHVSLNICLYKENKRTNPVRISMGMSVDSNNNGCELRKYVSDCRYPLASTKCSIAHTLPRSLFLLSVELNFNSIHKLEQTFAV